MTAARRTGRRRGKAVTAGVLVAAAPLLGACRWGPTSHDGPRPPDPTRAAQAAACIVTPRPARTLGLPLRDAATVRISPDVVGEKLIWQGGGRRVTAWVGINALDVYEDLDFVSVPQPAGRPREWTTRVRPELFVAETDTGHRAPCNLLYVSTEGFRAGAPLEVIDDLTVRMGSAADLVNG
jgi:hypothetical protein